MMESKINNENRVKLDQRLGRIKNKLRESLYIQAESRKNGENNSRDVKFKPVHREKKECLCIMTELYHRMGSSFLQKS